MNLKGLERYFPQIYSKICAYAVENRNEPVLINRYTIDWKGDIFDTANIETELHKDLIEDLKNFNLYDDIVANTDKFVILPDIFSSRPLPINMRVTERYDENKKRIVIINNILFSVVEQNMTHYSYNHNGYYYYFYKDAESQNMFSLGNSIEVIGLRDSFFDLEPDISTTPIIDDNSYWLPLDINVDIPTGINIPRVDIIINRPYFKYKIKAKTNEGKYEELPGIKSVSNDAWTSPKMLSILLKGDYIHNPNAIMSSSAIIKFKDNTWIHEKLDINQAGTYLEKIDKHSIKVLNTTNVDEIIIFYTNHTRENYSMVDSVYYKCIDTNPYYYTKLKGSQKDTTRLYEYIYETKPTVPELIEYGYKYDADILKIIQDFFRMKYSINFDEIKLTYETKGEDITYEPKLEVPVVNMLKLHPIVFINGKLFYYPNYIRKVDDVDYIYINVRDLLNFLNISIPKLTFTSSKVKTIENVTMLLKDKIDAIDIVFTQNYKLIDKYTTPVIYREPLTNYLICDEYGETKHKGRFTGLMFANGYYTPETFEINSDKTLKPSNILRRFDGISTWKMGELDFKLTTNPTKDDTWKPLKTTYSDGYSIFRDFGRQTLFYRLVEPIKAIVRPYFAGSSPIYLEFSKYIAGTKITENFSEHNTIMFDSVGTYVHGTILYGNQILYRDIRYEHKKLPDEVKEDMNIVINLEAYNKKYGLDARIDYTRLSHETFNVGCYNDKTTTNYPDILLLLKNGEEELVGEDVVLQEPKTMIFNKVMIRYYYANMGMPYKNNEFNTEIAPLGGTWIKNDGVLGTLTTEEEKMLEHLNKEDALNHRLLSEKVWYELISNQNRYKTSPDKEIVMFNKDIVNSSKSYNLDYDEMIDYYLGNKVSLSGMLNIVTKGVN